MYSLKLHKSSQLSSNRVNIRLSWNHLCQINYSITFHCRSGKFLLRRQQEASKYAKNIVSSWNVWDAITTVFQISTRIAHYRFIHFSCPQSQSLPHSSKTHMVRSSHSNNLTYSLLPPYVLVTLMLLWKKKWLSQLIEGRIYLGLTVSEGWVCITIMVKSISASQQAWL